MSPRWGWISVSPKVLDAKPVRLQTAPNVVRGEVGESRQQRRQVVGGQDRKTISVEEGVEYLYT